MSERSAAVTHAKSGAGRLTTLDGLRGVAAVLVVFWHSFLIAEPHLGRSSGKPGGVGWWLDDTPLYALISGPEAVMIFFLLSGIVVALPALGRSFDWLAYYPRRLVRLYVPVVAAVLLAALLIVVVPRTGAVAGWQQSTNARSVRFDELLRDLSLTTGAPTIDNPLWSLGWEVVFSLLLPLYVLVAVTFRRMWVTIVVAGVLTFAIGEAVHLPAVTYLPVFLIGAVGAASLDRVQGAADRISASPRGALWWPLVFAASVLCISGYRVISGIEFTAPWTILNHIAISLTIVGCIGVVFLAIGSRQAQAILNSRACQWLGRISFSLYLVHVPVLVTLAYALGSGRWWLAILIGIPLSILVARGFTAVIEQPAHRLSKRAGRWVSVRVRPPSRASAQLVDSRDPAAVPDPQEPSADRPPDQR